MINRMATQIGLISIVCFILGGSAWSQDQGASGGVTAYLKEIDAIQARLTIIATEMQNSTAGLQATISNGTFNPQVVNAKLGQVKSKMIAEQNKLRLLTGPEVIKSHQYYMDQQITITAKMLDELPQMLVRTKKLLELDAAAKASEDPAAQEKAKVAIDAEQQAILGHQAAVKGLTAELRKVSSTVASERTKLEELSK